MKWMIWKVESFFVHFVTTFVGYRYFSRKKLCFNETKNYITPNLIKLLRCLLYLYYSPGQVADPETNRAKRNVEVHV